ncbi:hypothetical protein U27_03440 [Candidatus Vecturithrix granuli]|uniref:DUF3782 domain-containing protein n=1 Tax=Vecturithrix granuli TaxID=1499967 RepID=A0A081BVX3_VECG1|nr:hypothetical protein U27_03440 [Candidatus Vecturithrix granuli]
MIDTVEVKRIVRDELSTIIHEDREFYEIVQHLVRDQWLESSERRFNKILDELRQDREEQSKKWEEQNQKWEENQKMLNQILQEIHKMSRKHESSIGALGSRWGLHTEESFRNALKSILEDSFDVQVVHVNEYDDSGEVFGHPDQVELDVIIKNGMLIVCEIKSSMSRSEVYSFEHKIAFYERMHDCQTSRKIIISPMVDKYAQRVAAKLGFEVYSYAEDVETI